MMRNLHKSLSIAQDCHHNKLVVLFSGGEKSDSPGRKSGTGNLSAGMVKSAQPQLA
jgi:hypothetical protein